MPVLYKARLKNTKPLPTPWFRDLSHRGELVEIGAATNVGKSFVALRWALALAEQGYPILYCGIDTNVLQQGERLFTMAHKRAPWDEEELLTWLRDSEIPMRWCKLSMTTQDLDGLLKAETVYFGESPAMTIIDVLGEFVHGEESVSKVDEAVRDLKALSREHNTCILALHHLRDGFAASGNTPVTSNDLRYEKGKYAETVFGLWRMGPNSLGMQVLKNRGGPIGELVRLSFDPRMGHVELQH